MARRGRERTGRGPWGVPRARAMLVLAATLLGCGGLENPDVAIGSVQGHITGAVAGAQAYVLGRPEIAAPIAGDGTFRLDGIPAGEQYLVLYDGDLGAEMLEVEVRSADLAQVGIDRPLAPAGSILAGGNPLEGVRSTGLVFAVDGTPLQGLKAEPAVTVFPLPSGKFSLRARQPGFKETVALVQVVSGQSVPVEMHLEVDDSSDARGCLSSRCEDGLSCDPADGHCYLCVVDADCAGGTCTADHVCRSAGSGGFCDACASGADCSGGSCATTNEHGDATPGYCTGACAPSCPAGTKCVNGTCQVALSCLAYATTFGATCLRSDACAAGIEGGTCYRPPGVPSTSLGTCTASCQGGAGCPTALGLACDPTAGFCREPCTTSAGCPQGLACGADGYCG